MNMVDFRGEFQREWLPELFLNNTEIYFEAIYDDRVEDLIKEIWVEMVKVYNQNPDDYPLEFEVETYNYDDGTMFSIIQMPEITKAKGKNLAIYAMVIFDTNNKKKPRFFLAETDYNSLNRLIFITEPVNDVGARANFGPLVYDMNIMAPVKKEDELAEFIEYVVRIYNSRQW